MKLVQFTTDAGQEVWVNADRVCSVREYDKDESITTITFGTDKGNVSVKATPSGVASKLASAGKA